VFTPEAGEWAGPIFVALALCVLIAVLRDRRAKRREANKRDGNDEIASTSDQRDHGTRSR
jgi:hypothetical protein